MLSGTGDMSCAAARERLDDYLDGALDAAGRAGFERHLAACAGCTAEARFAAVVLGALRGLPELECPPSALPPRATPRVAPPPVLRLVKEDSKEVRRQSGLRPAERAWRRLGVLVAAAAAVALLSVATWLWRPAAAPPSPEGRAATTATATTVSHEDVARAAAQARFALACVARLSQRAGAQMRRDVLARHVVGPLTEDVSQSLSRTLAGGGRADRPARRPARIAA